MKKTKLMWLKVSIVSFLRCLLFLNRQIQKIKKINRFPFLKSENKISVEEQLISDFSSANYIAIITSKPLEIEAELDYNDFSLRHLFVKKPGGRNFERYI